MSKPLDHPHNLVGIGGFIPVDRAFQIAREMFPVLQVVGVAWSPLEASSRAYVEVTHQECESMGITLLEADLDKSAVVDEVMELLASQGAEAIWVGADVTVWEGRLQEIAIIWQGSGIWVT